MKKIMYPLTYPQKAIWDMEQFYPNTSMNTISGKISIHDKVNVSLLEKAIQIYVKNTSGLRFRFHLENNYVSQYEESYESFPIDVICVTSENEEIIENKIASRKFILQDAPLFYFAIFKNENQTGGFFVSVHHLISDAWSMSQLISSILSIYSQLSQNQVLDESTLSNYSYADFIEQEKAYSLSNRWQQDENFWDDIFAVNHFDSSLSTSALSPDLSCLANRCEYKLSKSMTLKIMDFCKIHKISPFTFILFLMGIYEGKLKQSSFATISTPILNRTSKKEKETFGLFVNNTLFNLKLEDDASFLDAITAFSKLQFSYLRHQKYPAQKVMERIKNRFQIKDTIYHTSVSYQNARTNHQKGIISYDSKWLFSGYCATPLLLHIYDMDDTSRFTFIYDYQTNHYEESQIKDIHNRILHMANQVIENPSVLLGNIELATQEEKHKILCEFNDTKLPYDRKKTILDLWETQVKKHRQKTAIICESKTISFGELDQLSSLFAGFLQEKYHLQPNQNVSVILDRSFDLVVVALAILKCGCSYVLIDSAHPKERQEYMVNNSHSKYVISNLEVDFKNTISFDSVFELTSDVTWQKPDLSADSPMYLLYTSGSTGNPKAVTVTHQNFHNYFLGISQVVDYSDDKSVLSMASISFDVFGYELWVTLLHGLTLVLPTISEMKDFTRLNQLIIEHQVHVLYGTPSKIQSLLSDSHCKKSFALLTDIGIGGESLTVSFLKDLGFVTSANLYNMYGPTETTVGCSCKKITKNTKIITIGKPLANVRFYVLDKNLNLCPPGMKGELYISGDGVSKGYYGRPDLTKKSFLPDIFDNTLTMYRSGDMVSWTKQGEILFYGRADSQIKIRGYRIELSEIEKVLSEHPFIKTCAVIDYHHNNREFLCAYYSSDFTIQNYELKIFLSQKLPSYMIPSYFIAIPTLPLTVNGKIDRKQLPSPFHLGSAEKYVKPSTPLEKLVCQALEQALQISNLSIEEDFSNLGIDSLAIIRVQSSLSAKKVSIPTQYFYDYANVKDLCFAFENMTTSTDSAMANDNYPFLAHSVTNIVPKKQKISTVLLTGGTGFLGIHILDQLLQAGIQVYALIRSSNTESAKKRILSMFSFYFPSKYTDDFLWQNIHVIVGDITKKTCGISDSELETLGNTIDCVIHSAALVKHFGRYDEFKKMNLEGTKHIADFCMKYHLPLHYVSTISVSGDFMPLSSTKEEVSYTEESFFIGQSYQENYYIKSKILTEEYLLNQIKNGLLHANIYRVGNLIGRYEDGHFQYNIDSNAFYHKLQFILKNGFYYESSVLQEFDLSPVDKVASSLVDLLQNYGCQDKIFHVFHPKKFSMKTLATLLEPLGYPVKIISDTMFYKKISQMDLNTNSLIVSDYNLYTNVSYLNIRTNCDITCQYLQKIGVTYPDIDTDYLQKLISYMKDVKFI